MLQSHPNYNNDESTSWRDSTSGKLLLAKGERSLPWDNYLQDSKSDTFTKWTKAPEKPISKKLKTYHLKFDILLRVDMTSY